VVRGESPAPEDGFLVRRAHRLLEAGSRPALHPPLAFGPGGVTHGSAIDDAEIRMRGALAIIGPRARRAPGKTGIVRDVQDRHVVADERTAVERRPLAGGGDDDRAPASRPGVPFRGPVREDDDRHVRHGLAYPPPWPGINMLRIASRGDARYKRTEPWRDPTRRTSRPFSRPAKGRAR